MPEIEIEKLHPALGAKVHGVDLSKRLEAGELKLIRTAWAEHAVLVIPDQDITDDAHIEFSRSFGELEIFPHSDNRGRTRAEIFRVANTDEDGNILPVDDPTAKFVTLTWFWHTDSCYREIPSKGAILHGIQLPEEGGDTLFANIYAAYEALSDDRKKSLDGLSARHSFEYLRTLRGLPPMKEEERKSVPPAEHPVVRTHPDGRKSLYISPPYMERVGDMNREDTDAFVREMVEHSTRPDFVYRHRWSPHDFVMWDNRCTMHIVTPCDSANDRRVMHRTAIAGTDPVV